MTIDNITAFYPIQANEPNLNDSIEIATIEKNYEIFDLKRKTTARLNNSKEKMIFEVISIRYKWLQRRETYIEHSLRYA